MGIAERLRRLEAGVKPNTVDWQERLARYKRWFEDGEKWERQQTDEEKANLARHKRYFDELDAGVAAPRWDQL